MLVMFDRPNEGKGQQRTLYAHVSARKVLPWTIDHYTRHAMKWV